MFLLLAACAVLIAVVYLYYRKLARPYNLFEYAVKPIFILNAQDEICYANRAYKALAVHKGKLSINALFNSNKAVIRLFYGLKAEAIKGHMADAILPLNDDSMLHLQAQLLDNAGNLLCSLEVLTQENTDSKPLKINNEVNVNIDNLPLAACLIDKKGALVKHNSNFYIFFELDKLESKLQDLINPLDAKKLLQLFNRQHGAELAIDSTLRDNRHIKLFARKELSSDTILLLLLETTENEFLGQTSGENHKLQVVGQLAGGVAHDFNNILTAIIMSCDFLLNNHRSSDPAYPDLVSIKQNAERAAVLVHQLLAFSRRQNLRPVIVHMPDLIADTNSMLARILRDTTNLEINYGAALWPVSIDYVSFQRVMMNLLINAQDALGKNGGNIEIAVQNVPANEVEQYKFVELAHENYLLVSISDNGSGMAADVQAKIFEPFFTTKDIGKGTGLGLAMAYGIVKQSHGVIACQSELGKGTNFYIFLPATRAEVLANNSNVTVEESKTDPVDLSGSGNLLIVDDEDAIRSGLVRSLITRGYKVKEADNGAHALEVFSEDIDLVICDVLMPEMDGPTLYLHLKRLNPTIKFLFVSGFTKEIFQQKYQELGTDFHFISKPFSLKQLAVRVKEIL